MLLAFTISFRCRHIGKTRSTTLNTGRVYKCGRALWAALYKLSCYDGTESLAYGVTGSLCPKPAVPTVVWV